MKHTAQAQKIMAKLPATVYNKLRNNDMESAKDYFKLYVELSGKSITPQQLKTQLIEEYTTQNERLKLRKQMPLETLMVIKRLDQTMKELGYAE